MAHPRPAARSSAARRAAARASSRCAMSGRYRDDAGEAARPTSRARSANAAGTASASAGSGGARRPFRRARLCRRRRLRAGQVAVARARAAMASAGWPRSSHQAGVERGGRRGGARPCRCRSGRRRAALRRAAADRPVRDCSRATARSARRRSRRWFAPATASALARAIASLAPGYGNRPRSISVEVIVSTLTKVGLPTLAPMLMGAPDGACSCPSCRRGRPAPRWTRTMSSVPAEMEPITGRVKWFDATRGFGFLVSDEVEGDVLLHFSVLREHGRRSVPEGAHDRMRAGQARSRPAGQESAVDRHVARPCRSSRARPFRARERADRKALADAAGEFEPVEVKWFNRVRGYGFRQAARRVGRRGRVRAHGDGAACRICGELQPGQKLEARIAPERQGADRGRAARRRARTR